MLMTATRRPDDATGTEALERLEAIVRAEAAKRQVARDSAGRPVSVREADGAECVYEYDVHGNLLAITSGGMATRFEYDTAERLTRVSEPSGVTCRYVYNAGDRLERVEDEGRVHRFEHDAAGRLVRAHYGSADTVVYRYDEHKRVSEARTSRVSSTFEYDGSGRTTGVTQVRDGVAVSLHLHYGASGHLDAIDLCGEANRVFFEWDAKGRPHWVRLGARATIDYEYDDSSRTVVTTYSNGVRETVSANPVDARPASRQVRCGTEVVHERRYVWGADARLESDGARRWHYDEIGRLDEAIDRARRWSYRYDDQDNRRTAARVRYDERGRLRWCAGRVFQYNDRDELTAVLRHGSPIATIEYDHKSRLAAIATPDGVRRYIYGPGDELFAVTNERGEPLCLYVRTPFACIARIDGPLDSGSIFFLHGDERGTCDLVTDLDGQIAVRYEYEPFGFPLSPATRDDGPVFHGRPWMAAIGLYRFGARWYEPRLGRFLTPDSFTGRPDDERIVNPVQPAANQRALRTFMLDDWLTHPRCRNRFAFCGHDPVGGTDPNGHWSFGGVLLSILGAIWTLPNTLFGILIEITCLVGEVVRWIVWLVTGGSVSWATPGFDAAASGRLNAFALVFRGGWLGSFSSLLGITFGNVFFVYHDWENHPAIAIGGDVSPAAYGGTVTFPRRESLYEHELRHTNQYAWFGPFFHLGLPIWGVYVWDLILSGGYDHAWLERDAREHGGI
jgi:RHS repeat-associated protein